MPGAFSAPTKQPDACRFESVLAPGFVVGAHIHRDEDEYWYMLDGGLEVRLDERQIPIAPGTIVAIPAGILHQITNAGSSKVRSIVFTMPGGLEHFFAGLDELVRRGAGPEEFTALFERTGTTFPQGL